MIKNLQVTVIVAVLAIILLGALPSLALVRADNSGDSSQSSCPDGSQPDSNGNCPQQQQQSCPDGSQPDSNGNYPNQSSQSQQQQQQPQQTDTRTQICNALHVKDIGILAPLLVALHLITLGASTVAILGAAAA